MKAIGNAAVEALKKRQSQIAKSLPNDKAKQVTNAVQSLAGQQGGQVSPVQSAQLLVAAQQ